MDGVNEEKTLLLKYERLPEHCYLCGMQQHVNEIHSHDVSQTVAIPGATTTARQLTMASIQERNITPRKQLKTEGEDSNNKNSGSFVTASNSNNGTGKHGGSPSNAASAKNSNQNLAFSGSAPLTNKLGSFYWDMSIDSLSGGLAVTKVMETNKVKINCRPTPSSRPNIADIIDRITNNNNTKEVSFMETDFAMRLNNNLKSKRSSWKRLARSNGGNHRLENEGESLGKRSGSKQHSDLDELLESSSDVKPGSWKAIRKIEVDLDNLLLKEELY
ncbi:hypothetical protein ACOSQ4_018197 [Xanthoceras sorbifolium]